MQTKTRKLFSSLLALAVLISVFFGMALTANAAVGDACAIGDVEYETIGDAIDAVEPGQAAAETIILLRDVVQDEEGLFFDDQKIIIDLAGYDLKITKDNSMDLDNGSVVDFDYNDGNFESQWIYVYGGSSLSLPYYDSDLAETGILCYETDSSITIDGDVSFSSEQSQIYAFEGGKITVRGNASQDGESDGWDFIRCSDEDSEIIINGDVSASACAVVVLNDGKITVDGNIDAGELGVYGFVSEEYIGDENVYGGTVNIGGDINSGFNGVDVMKANVTIAGGITAAGEFGVRCLAGGEVYVGDGISVITDNPEFPLEVSEAVKCADEGSKVEVGGDIAVITVDSFGYGVDCWNGGEVTVSGSITITGPYAGALWCADPGSRIEVFDNITVTATETNSYSSGIDCYDEGNIKVTGNITITATGVEAVTCGDEKSKLEIIGNITAIGLGEDSWNCALDCTNGAEAEVTGNVTAVGNSDTVCASEGATVTINGNIQSNSDFYSNGIWCGENAKITVNGNVSAGGDAFCIGVWCQNGEITIDGAIISTGTNAAYIGFGYSEEDGWAYPETTVEKEEGEAYVSGGAAYLKEDYLTYTDQPEGDSYVWVHVEEAPGISDGQASMTLTVGYGATSTAAFSVSGIPVPEISVSGGEERVTWDPITKKLDIAPGLAAGTYPIVLTATNGVATAATFTFTLTVEAGGGTGTTYTVTFNSNGGTAVASQTVTAGGKASQPDNPTREGYNFGGWYSNSALTEVYNFAAEVTGNITVYAKWTEKQGTSPGWKNPFTDVKIGDWFYDHVQYVYEKGLFKGITNTLFAPNQPISRAMMITVLARYAGVNTAGGPSWYSQAVAWGMENDITDGTNLDANVTREQIATMIWRYIGEPESDGDLSGFSDRAKISAYALTAMKWAVENGIINGYPDKTLRPQDDATRAEVAAIFHRIVAKWGMGNR